MSANMTASLSLQGAGGGQRLWVRGDVADRGAAARTAGAFATALAQLAANCTAALT